MAEDTKKNDEGGEGQPQAAPRTQKPAQDQTPTPKAQAAERKAKTAPAESPGAKAEDAKKPEGGQAGPGPEAGGDAKPAASEGAAGPRTRGSRKPARVSSAGVAHIKATFNNTIVTITDMRGSTVAWSSAGRAGFKGARKSTAFAATIVAQEAARQVLSRGMREVEVRVQGPGSGRESAIRGLQAAGLNIAVIKDVTPMPHNGCRPPKRRRV